MKVLLLSDTHSEHTEKWALGLANSGIKVGLFSFNKASYDWYVHENITVFFEPENKINAESTLTKLAYIKYVSILKKIIKQFEPDILHAHYATSYGLVGALADFHPFIISSWGTDVMKFPNKNFVAKSILKFNFKKADLLCATSYTIKEYINQVISIPVSVIPFGINIDEFKPKPVKSLFKETDFVLGSIKPVERLYNIDILIRSFAKLLPKYDNLKLLIIGEGSERKALQELCTSLGINEKVTFTGRIPFKDVSNYYNMLNVLVNISEYESFGVSVVEAMACGKPVVVTNVG
ncbi:MAG: glycosyltransferase, partial [Bacteroidia bacterium]